TVLLAFGVLLIGVLAGTLWWLSRGGLQELEVQIWSVEGEHKHAVIASNSFVQQNDSALAKELLDDIRRWVVSIVAPGEEPAKSLVKVHVSVPADLENQRIQLNADADIALQTHLYVVRGTGKARVVSDLNPDTLALLKEDFVIEIGAVGYRSIPIEVAWGRPVDKTVELSAGSLRVRLAVEDFAGEENTVAQRLAHLLAKDPRLSMLGPDALERLRQEISEIRKNVGFNPAIQMPVRDSLGVDYIISGTYQRR
ncbi:MAG: hypothetical protein WBR56_18080, partial [Sedimenticolaceae bacterium]